MTKLELIMILLPIVFMIHEYEEIIMFRNCIYNHRTTKTNQKYPSVNL